MHLIVTGSSGLLGQALRRTLPIWSSDKDIEISFMTSEHCDLRDDENVMFLFAQMQPTHVIHLAARVGGLFDNMEHNNEYFVSNVRINTNVLNACSKLTSVVKVVSCLSTCIFPQDAKLPLTVDQLHCGLPHSSNIGYSFAKRMIDVQNRILHQPGVKTFTGVIPTNLFGPYDNFSLESGHVIPALIHKCYLAKQNNDILRIKGSGKAVRQFLYALDAARLMMYVLDRYNDSKPVIMAPQEEYTIAEIVQKITRILQFTGSVTFEYDEENSNDGQNKKTADGSELLRLISSDSKLEGISFVFTPIDDALETTITWFLSHLDTCRT
jgi:GDP-L-fucose synthase